MQHSLSELKGKKEKLRSSLLEYKASHFLVKKLPVTSQLFSVSSYNIIFWIYSSIKYVYICTKINVHVEFQKKKV